MAERFLIDHVLRQSCHIDDEAVADVAFDDAVVGFVDVLDRGDFDVAGDVVLAAEIEHFLGFWDTADM